MLKACGGDERLALQRWMETLKWRCDIGDEEMFSVLPVQNHSDCGDSAPEKKRRTSEWPIWEGRMEE